MPEPINKEFVKAVLESKVNSETKYQVSASRDLSISNPLEENIKKEFMLGNGDINVVRNLVAVDNAIRNHAGLQEELHPKGLSVHISGEEGKSKVIYKYNINSDDFHSIPPKYSNTVRDIINGGDKEMDKFLKDVNFEKLLLENSRDQIKVELEKGHGLPSSTALNKGTASIGII